MKIFESEEIFVTVYFIATAKKYYDVLELRYESYLLFLINPHLKNKCFWIIKSWFVKIGPREKFENGRFAKVSIREIFGKGWFVKLVLAKYDFFDLAKINPIKVLKNDQTHLKHTMFLCMDKLQGLAL